MSLVGDRHTDSSAIARPSGVRPVMLVTFDVPFVPEAASLAVEAAVESRQPLLVVNVAEVPILPISIAMGYEYSGTDEVEESLRAPAELAHSLAVKVERLRVCSPHPLAALLELVVERRPGLFVLGPDKTRMRHRKFKRAEARVLRDAPCLVWSGQG
jgi:hypothetical protein